MRLMPSDSIEPQGLAHAGREAPAGAMAGLPRFRGEHHAARADAIRLVLALAGAVFAAAGILASVGAQAQGYPSRPIRMIVPYPPGGGIDAIARPFAEKLSAILGQPLVIENRPGAGGNIGAETAARSPADGYTLLFANEFLSTNPNLYTVLRYDTQRDFAPITKVGMAPVGIAIHPSVPANDMKELVALSQKKAINYATPGIGSGPHLFGELLNLTTSLKLNHIPYKGSAPAITDTVGGQVEIVITTLSPMVPHIRAGRLRGIAVAGDRRTALLPELPTLAESGLPGFNYEIWYGLLAPAGTPKQALGRAHEASVEALAQPELIERLRKAGYEPGSSTPEELAALIKSDSERWRRVVSDAKIPKE
jgi:tripartite-type tricarboxylate transporter receptor subunit TctC